MCRRLSLLALLLLAAFPAQAQVSRSEAISTAETYLTLKWTPTAANAFHGRDRAGILIETPDVGFNHPDTRPGWWLPKQVNIGMPYKWGGFSSPAEFIAGLKRGVYAGDVYTEEKRRLGDTAVSQQTIGIDCSGLVSRCWKLERAYSTKELPGLCLPLDSYEKLKPGDILNVSEKHVLLFKAFIGEDKQRLLAYKAGSPPTWKVLLNSIPVTMLKEQEFKPYRYRLMRD